jgi:hypothetical protein
LLECDQPSAIVNAFLTRVWGFPKPGHLIKERSPLLSVTVFHALQLYDLADRKLRHTPSTEAAVKFRCDNCHHEIKQTPLIEARRKFCNGHCNEHWKRRALRQQAQKPTH